MEAQTVKHLEFQLSSHMCTLLNCFDTTLNPFLIELRANVYLRLICHIYVSCVGSLKPATQV